MEKQYTLRDFSVNSYAYGRDIITASGYLSSYSEKYEINTSSILTRLIQEAGRFCENYASDLFIDWQDVECSVDLFSCAEKIEKVFLFGFRQDGVDGENFIFSRYNSGNHSNPRAEYRSMWRLDISADGRKIEMTLGRVF